MAKNPKQPIAPTKKHLARLAREKQQSRWIVIGTITVLAIVVGLILFGFLNEMVLKPNRNVAKVNTARILVKDFQGYTRFIRSTLVDSAIQTYQFLQFFENDPNTLASFVPQLQQYQGQLDPLTVGQQAIEQMVDNEVIYQEAKRRGITVNDNDINSEFESILGYFPQGTPTSTPTLEPLSTSTFTPLQLTALAPTSTPVITITQELILTPTEIISPSEIITPTSTLAPTSSPTPYTAEGYQTELQGILEKYKGYGVSEGTLKYVIESQLLRDKLFKAFLEETNLPRTREEVWARHILVEDEATAKETLTRLENGEDWCTLAEALSLDESNKSACGDLGWFSRGKMVAPFEDAAFSQPIGELSDPIQSGFGWHMIYVLGREDRPISDTEYQQQLETEFTNFIQNLRLESNAEIFDLWSSVTPDQPELPMEIQLFIQQYASQNQP